jgi:hypothetical protein
MEPMCIIYWKALEAGFIGHGEAIKCSLATAWIEHLNQTKGMIHWIEKVIS